MQQAFDFLSECRNLHGLLGLRDERELALPTGFKQWTISDIVRHLAVWDTAARLTLQDSEEFQRFFAPVPGHVKAGRLRDFERAALPGEGHALLQHWWGSCQETARLYAGTDPKKRLKWGGPDLSARTCITSRLMETWAHGQAIYDELGLVRADGDWIRDVVQIGLQTFEWTFRNRGLEPPGVPPNLELTAPGGAPWRWDSAQSNEHIRGSATEFCQVVAQTRNVADTRLEIDGPVGRAWMAIAQCFAGPPSDPPRSGERRRKAIASTGPTS